MRPARRLSIIALVMLSAASLCGCQSVILLGYLIGGPPAIEPDFHKQTGKLLDGKETTVLVMCYAPKELKWDNDAVEYELAKHLAYRFTTNKIKVIDPDRVHDWLDKHNDWEKATEVGAAFEVNYVIHVDLKAYSLFEEQSHELYRGRADALVTVFEMDENKKKGDVIYSKDLQSRFPTSGPVSQYTVPYANFKKMYLSTLSQEIGILFYEHFAGDDIPNTALNL